MEAVDVQLHRFEVGDIWVGWGADYVLVVSETVAIRVREQASNHSNLMNFYFFIVIVASADLGIHQREIAILYRMS